MVAFSSHRHADPDLSRPFRHGHEQDIHDADPTDYQGHGGNGKQHHRQGLTGAFLDLPDIDLGPDRKIIVLLRLKPMPRPQHLSNLFSSHRQILDLIGRTEHRPDGSDK